MCTSLAQSKLATGDAQILRHEVMRVQEIDTTILAANLALEQGAFLQGVCVPANAHSQLVLIEVEACRVVANVVSGR